MRALICGSRTWDDSIPIRIVLYGLAPTVLIHGGAPGADTLADNRAEDMGLDILCFPADWKKYGRAAGPIRNQQMLDEGKPDVVFAFTDDLATSKGTADMVRRARKAGLPVYVIGRPV